MASINGSKTYILGILGLLYALSGFSTGHIDANTAIEIAGGSLGMVFIRHGIQNSQS